MSEPTSMRKVREILRLKHGCGRSQREIAHVGQSGQLNRRIVDTRVGHRERSEATHGIWSFG
jgi:hypothetical protein